MAYPPAGYTSRRERKWASVPGKKPALRPDKRARGGGISDDVNSDEMETARHQAEKDGYIRVPLREVEKVIPREMDEEEKPVAREPEKIEKRDLDNSSFRKGGALKSRSRGSTKNRGK